MGIGLNPLEHFGVLGARLAILAQAANEGSRFSRACAFSLLPPNIPQFNELDVELVSRDTCHTSGAHPPDLESRL